MRDKLEFAATHFDSMFFLLPFPFLHFPIFFFFFSNLVFLQGQERERKKERRERVEIQSTFFLGNVLSTQKLSTREYCSFHYPTTNGDMQNGTSVAICTHCIHVFAGLASICVLSRRLLTEFLHRSSSGSLLRVPLLVG